MPAPKSKSTQASGPSLIVEDGCSILLPDMRLVTAGQVIKPAEAIGLRQKVVEEWIRDGKVRRAHANDEREESRVPLAPDAKITPLPTAAADSALEHGKETLKADTKPSLSQPAKEPPAPVKVKEVGKWSYDPAGLAGKTLAQLNAMVLDKDPTVAPFETVEEAVPFLSQHFQPA